MFRLLLFSLTIMLMGLIFVDLPIVSVASAQDLRIGVLANQGKEKCFERWQATATYLKEKLTDTDITLFCLDFEELPEAVSSDRVDFAVSNPAIYVVLENKYGASRIATLRNAGSSLPLTHFGGTIFRRSDRKDIATFEDIKGARFAAVSENSFGGWLVARKHLLDLGIDALRDVGNITFYQRHDAVVFAVQNGQVDVGNVRTDTLERMEAKGEIRMSDFHVFEADSSEDDQRFPFKRTTILYPEWPFAKMRETSEDLAKKVAIALLEMKPESEAARSSNSAGWTIPLDYSLVHECLRQLRIMPYDDLGKVSLIEVYHQYRYWLLVYLLLFTLVLAGLGIILVLYRKQKRFMGLLEYANNERLEVIDYLSEFKITLDAVNDSVFVFDDKSMKFQYVNKVGVDNVEYSLEELLEMTPLDISPEYQKEEFKELLAGLSSSGQRSKTYITEHVSKNGRRIPVEVFLQHIVLSETKAHYVAIIRNISERLREEKEKERMKTRLLGEQKLASVGQLAAGIAHEINTPAQYVASNIDFIGEAFSDLQPIVDDIAELCTGNISTTPGNTVPESLAGRIEDADWAYLREELPRAIEQSRDGLGKISSIVRAMKDFSRPGNKSREPIDLNRILETTITVTRNEWKYIARLEYEPDAQLPAFSALADEIGQVFLNIIVNAAQAIDERWGAGGGDIQGLIKIKTGHEGNYVWVRITDNGSGIPDEIRDRIFDPFFTTKDVGKGTGQGLAIAGDIIVNKHGGTINYSGMKEGGTEFLIRFPLHKEDPKATD